MLSNHSLWTASLILGIHSMSIQAQPSSNTQSPSRVAYDRGSELLKKNRTTEAIKFFDEAIRSDPSYADAFTQRGIAKSEQANHDGAIQDFEEAIRLKPKSAGNFYNRGLEWRSKQDLTKALKDYDMAINLDANNSNFFLQRGTVYAEQREWNRAMSDLGQAIHFDAKNIEAYFFRGKIWQENNEMDKAIADLTKRLFQKSKLCNFLRSLILKPLSWSCGLEVCAASGESNSI